MEIGTLTGEITLEDHVSESLEIAIHHVKHFIGEFEGMVGVVALGAGVFAAAVGGAMTSIIELGEHGSVLLGVESAFDRLAEAAGTSGHVLREDLSEALRGTVGEMSIMQSVNKALAAGVKLSGEDAKLMGEAARAMGKAMGTDASDGLRTFSSALATGNTRLLKQAGIVVDVKGGMERYAETLGLTAKQLDATHQLEGKRFAILETTRGYIDRLGVSELSFKERIQQSQVAIEEWTEKLEKSIAASPHVMAAYDAIAGAIQKAFGNASETALETIVRWVNNFADAAAHYGPIIIQTLVDIRDWVLHVWDSVKAAWDTVPDWFKNIARDAGLAGLAVGGVALATNEMTGTDILGALSNLAQIWSVIGGNVTKASAAIKEWFLLVGAFKWEAVAMGAKSILVALEGLAATPAGIAALFTALGAALYQVYGAVQNLYRTWTEGKSMWEFFTAKDSDNWVRRWLGLSKGVDTVTTSIDSQRKSLEALMKAGAHGKGEIPTVVGSDPVVAPLNVDPTALADLKKFEEAYKRVYASIADVSDATRDRIRTLIDEKQAEADIEQVLYLKPGQLRKVAEAYTLEKEMTKSALDYERKRYDESLAESNRHMEETLRAQKANGELMASMQRELTDRRKKATLSEYDYEAYQIEQWVIDQQSKWTEAAGDYQTYVDTIRAIAEDKYRQIQPHVVGADPVGILSGLKSSLAQVPSLLKEAFTGGGNIVGAMKAMGVLLGENFARTLTESIRENVGSLSGTGATAAGGIGAIAGIAAAAQGASAKAALGQVAMAALGVSTSAALAAGSLTSAAIAAGALTFGVGAAAVGAYLLIKHFVSISKEVKEARKNVKDFEGNIASTLTQAQLAEAGNEDWKKTVIGVRDAYLEMGGTAAQAEAQVKALWNTNNPAASDAARAMIAVTMTMADTKRGVMDLIQAYVGAGVKIPEAMSQSIALLVSMGKLTKENASDMLGLVQVTVPSMADITAAAGRYGLELSQLGPAVEGISIREHASQVIKDFDLMTLAGVPFEVMMQDMTKLITDAGGATTTVTTGMHHDIQEMVSKSIGPLAIELPEAFRPIIQQMIDAGGPNGLVDQFGQSMTDLSLIHFKVDPIDRLNETIKELILTLTTGLPNALTGLGRVPIPPINVPYHFVPTDEAPEDAFQQSGGGSAPAARGAGGPNSIVVQAWDAQSVDSWLRKGNNARQLANAVVPEMQGVVARRS